MVRWPSNWRKSVPNVATDTTAIFPGIEAEAGDREVIQAPAAPVHVRRPGCRWRRRPRPRRSGYPSRPGIRGSAQAPGPGRDVDRRRVRADGVPAARPRPGDGIAPRPALALAFAGQAGRPSPRIAGPPTIARGRDRTSAEPTGWGLRGPGGTIAAEASGRDAIGGGGLLAPGLGDGQQPDQRRDPEDSHAPPHKNSEIRCGSGAPESGAGRSDLEALGLYHSIDRPAASAGLS